MTPLEIHAQTTSECQEFPSCKFCPDRTWMHREHASASVGQTTPGPAQKANVSSRFCRSRVGKQVQIITTIHLQHKRLSVLSCSKQPPSSRGNHHLHRSGRSSWSCGWPESSLSAPTSAAPQRRLCWGLGDPAPEGRKSGYESLPRRALTGISYVWALPQKPVTFLDNLQNM